MTLIALVALTFLPLAAFVAWLARSGSRSLAGSALAIGVALLAVVVAAVAEATLAPLFARPFPGSVVVDALFRIAVVEEAAKLLAIAIVIRAGSRSARSGAGTRAALTIAVLVSLSVASFETLHYGTRAAGSLAPRLLFAIPLHVAASMIASLSLAKGWRGGRYLAVAALSHAAFNLALSAGYPLSLAAYLIVPVLGLVALNLWLKSGDPDTGKEGDS
jgi:hypothetical protein